MDKSKAQRFFIAHPVGALYLLSTGYTYIFANCTNMKRLNFKSVDIPDISVDKRYATQSTNKLNPNTRNHSCVE